MDNELDDVAKALFNGQIPPSWRKLAPATLKNLGGWMDHFIRRHLQYLSWVRGHFLALLKSTFQRLAIPNKKAAPSAFPVLLSSK